MDNNERDNSSSGAAGGVVTLSSNYLSFSALKKSFSDATASENNKSAIVTLTGDYLSFSNNNNNNAPAAADPLAAAASAEDTTIVSSSSRRSTSSSRRRQYKAADRHRGFSTSMNDMYSRVDNERVDCCAMACCGIFQSDRDRYLLQGVTPPGPIKRCSVHFLLPICIFLLAGMAATHIRDARLNQAVSTSLVFFLIGYFCMQCYKGSRKRKEIRKDLLFLKYQILSSSSSRRNNRASLLLLLQDERPPEDHDSSDCCGDSSCWMIPYCCAKEENRPPWYLGQTRQDVGCAHAVCCGLYKDDSRYDQLEDSPNSNTTSTNFCRKLWTLGCGPCCGMQLTVCGICAVAQEAREIENVILPASYRRIDYITMQAIGDYYPAIYTARWAPAASAEWSSVWKLFPPLSRLSTRLLQSLAAIVTFLLVWCFVGPLISRNLFGARKPNSHGFGFSDFAVFLATWVESVGLLVLIACFLNRKTSSGGTTRSYLSVDAIIKLFASGFFLSTSLAVFWQLLVAIFIRLIVDLLLVMTGTDEVSPDGYNSGSGWTSSTNAGEGFIATAASSSYLDTFGNSHPFFYTIYIAVNCFLMAALVEEICKYFGYRMVSDHPDFLSKEDLDEASHILMGENDLDDDEDEESPRRGRDRRPQPPDYSNQLRSVQAQGAAITLAMIAVAMGFTCCENLVYIFEYDGSSAKSEFGILLTRTLFPVHPIAAALQSIGVCKRDLEASRETQFGRIILPALLFHGTYDFFVIWIDYLARRDGVYATDDMAFEQGSTFAVLISFGLSFALMAVALIYLHKESRLQRQRLADIDRQASVDRSRLL